MTDAMELSSENMSCFAAETLSKTLSELILLIAKKYVVETSSVKKTNITRNVIGIAIPLLDRQIVCTQLRCSLRLMVHISLKEKEAEN